MSPLYRGSRLSRLNILNCLFLILFTGTLTADAQSRVPPRERTGGAATTRAGKPPVKANPNFPAAPLARQLQMSACYVKETTDRAWQIRIVGELPRGPGIYVIVYNQAGEVVHRDEIPFGVYTAQRPHVVNIRADGKAQQYAIRLIGQQDNLNGITLPLTNLALEVYGDDGYSFGHGTTSGQKRLAAFQVVDEKPIHFTGRGHYRILDDSGAVVVDSKEHGIPMGDPARKRPRDDIEVIAKGLQPGRTYWIDPHGLMYMGVFDTYLYLTFDPERWFAPEFDWKLQERPWWKGMP